jgi:hypothetical protein
MRIGISPNKRRKERKEAHTEKNRKLRDSRSNPDIGFTIQTRVSIPENVWPAYRRING